MTSSMITTNKTIVACRISRFSHTLSSSARIIMDDGGQHCYEVNNNKEEERSNNVNIMLETSSSSSPSSSSPTTNDNDNDHRNHKKKTIILTAQKGDILRTAMLRQGISPHNGKSRLINCRGLGTCGTCAVEIYTIATPIPILPSSLSSNDDYEHNSNTTTTTTTTATTVATTTTTNNNNRMNSIQPKERNKRERFRLNFPPHNNQQQSSHLRLACQVQVMEGTIVVKKRTGLWGQGYSNSDSKSNSNSFPQPPQQHKKNHDEKEEISVLSTSSSSSYKEFDKAELWLGEFEYILDNKSPSSSVSSPTPSPTSSKNSE